MITKFRTIKTVKELKTLSSGEEPLECFIALAGGAVRSTKSIMYHRKKFNVFHEVDGTEENLTDKQLKESNIGIAIKKGALFTAKN